MSPNVATDGGGQCVPTPRRRPGATAGASACRSPGQGTSPAAITWRPSPSSASQASRRFPSPTSTRSRRSCANIFVDQAAGTGEHTPADRLGIRARSSCARDDRYMGTHRLPGMSIDADVWQGLTSLADAIGVTRTDLITEAIALLVRTDANPDLQLRMRQLEHELLDARRRLEAARIALVTDVDADSSVAA